MNHLKDLKFNFLLICLAVLVSLTIIGEAAASDYYMATNGSNNNNCSFKYPCATIAYAMTKLSAGDTLYVRSGTYTGQSVNWTKSGSAGNEITIRKYPSDPTRPKFDGNQTSYLILFASGNGIHHVVFDGLEVYDYRGSFVNMQDSHDITVKNCYMHDILAGSSGVILARENTIPGSSYNLIIENNIFENNGGTAGSSLNHSIYFSISTHDSIIRGNKFTDITAQVGGQIQFYTTGTAPYNNSIYNNVFYIEYISYQATSIYNQGANYIYNNTFYADCKSSSNVCRYIKNVSSSAVIKNNIFYSPQPSADMANFSNATTDYNLWYPSKDSDDTGASSKAGDPMFVNVGSGNFRPSLGSPAIDKGTALSIVPNDYDDNKRPLGLKYDIGAFEYGSGGSDDDIVPPEPPVLMQ